MTKITRRSFTLLSGSSVLAHAGLFDTFRAHCAVRADAATVNSTVFPYCTHVYREPHLPLEQLRHDFPILKRLGFTMIKIQEVWGYDEIHQGRSI